MSQLALLYLAAILAGFSLIVVTLLGIEFLSTVAPVLVAVGAVAVIVFALALLYLAVRALFNRHFS